MIEGSNGTSVGALLPQDWPGQLAASTLQIRMEYWHPTVNGKCIIRLGSMDGLAMRAVVGGENMDVLSCMAPMSEGLSKALEMGGQDGLGGSTGTHKWVDFASGAQAVVTALVLLVGGAWAVFRFRLYRETARRADLQVIESKVVQGRYAQVMYVNVLLANRAKTLLSFQRVDYKWHEITARRTAPLPDVYKGPRDLIPDPDKMEPGKEAWGVVRIELPPEAKGAILWVKLHPKRVGLTRWLTRLASGVRLKAYEEPPATQWTFFIPVEEQEAQGRRGPCK